MNKTISTVQTAATSGAFHIEQIYPIVDGGRFAVKRIVGEKIEVWADIYRDGHEVIAAAVIWRNEHDSDWRRADMRHFGNDRWTATFTPETIGRHVYAIEAWTDEFASWRHGLTLKLEAGQDVSLDALEGAGLLTRAHGGSPEAGAVIQPARVALTGRTASPGMFEVAALLGRERTLARLASA